MQFVIGTTESFDQLNTVTQQFMQEAQKSGMFIFLDTDLKYDQPQSQVEIDRDKAALLGLTMQDVGSSLASMLGGGYVNYFSMAGRSYKVIPQIQQSSRLNADQLLDYYIRTADGAAVPLSTIATISTKTVPQSLNHFQQLNAAIISGVPFPGVTLGDAINSLKSIAVKVLPPGYSVDYAGQSRQLVKESSGFIFTFLFALVIIFLALAAQFESFRDPLIILVSVPMSIAGALIFIALGYRRGDPQHLYRSRFGDPDGINQQTRHPDRRIRQYQAKGRHVQTCSDRDGCRYPASAYSNDHRRDGAGCFAADFRNRRGCCVAF